jgi:hypothetical protein
MEVVNKVRRVHKEKMTGEITGDKEVKTETTSTKG